ncbi:hypothetical protein Trydic_g22483 [Trypoxylus dichotomus]
MSSYWLVTLGVCLCARSAISASIEGQLSDKTSETVENSTIENPIDSKPAKEVITLGAETFSDHVGQGNHFVMFYAPWCGHSVRLEPTWKELAESPEFDGKVTIARVDCESNKKICNDYKIDRYPTLLWIKNGIKVDRFSKERTYENLSSFIKYFKTEKQNNGPLLQLLSTQQRVANALVSSFWQKEATQKNKTKNLPEAIKMNTRNTLYSMYSQNRQGMFR